MRKLAAIVSLVTTFGLSACTKNSEEGTAADTVEDKTMQIAESPLELLDEYPTLSSGPASNTIYLGGGSIGPNFSYGLCNILQEEQAIHHPNQVKDPSELIIGKRYLSINIDPCSGRKSELEVEIVGVDEPKKGWFRACKYFSSGTSFETTASMIDNGIIPDERGLWNGANYLIPKED